MFLWTLAWMAKVRLDTAVPWLVTGLGGFAFWTCAKLILWVVPAVWLIRRSGRRVSQVFNLSAWRLWLVWGLGTGLCIALTGLVPKIVQARPLLPTELSAALVNVLVVAPVFEELLMRGAVLGNLLQRWSLARSSVVSALMFVGMHMPGWYFMGVLDANMTRLVGGALSIFLLGLVFAFATVRGRSVMGGVLAHALNNLAS